MWTVQRTLLLPICGSFLLSSCVAGRVHTVTPAFAKAVNLASHNASSAFELVEQQHERAEAMRLAVNYDAGGFNPNAIQPWLPQQDLDVRLRLLKSLRVYAADLAAVSSAKPGKEIDTSGKEFAASFSTLSSSAPLRALAKKTGFDPNAAATAVDALGRWFVERKRNRDLPKLIEDMQQPVETICSLLQRDIGTRTEGSHGTGLRDQLWVEYTTLMMEQGAFIDHNGGQLGPIEKRREIEQLPRLVLERGRADQMLAHTAECLNQLTKANAELLDAVKSKQPLTANIDSLADEASQLGDFYQSLSSPTATAAKKEE